MNAEHGIGGDLNPEERVKKVIADAPVSVEKRAFHGALISREAAA
jgi:hypothetical protein